MLAEALDTPHTLAGLAGERFGERPARGARPLMLLLHGGSFLGGSAADVAPLARRLAGLGIVVQTLSYPTHAPFPAALDALTDALAELARERGALAGKAAPLYVAGVEAGANLAAALALRARDEGGPRLAGQLLIAPMLDARLGSAAMREAKQGAADCVFARGWKHYLEQCRHAEHPYAVPASATRLAGVAPALLVAAEGDPLRDDTLRYAAQLRAAGVAASELLLPARADPHHTWSQLLAEQVQAFLRSTAPASYA